MLPDADAVRVVMVEVPPMFNTAPLPWVSPPVPVKAVATVKVVLLVRVTPVTVMLGIEIAVVPPIDWLFVSKVCTPDPAVKVVPLWVIPPRNVTAAPAELFQMPPELIVTKPTNTFAPVPPVIPKVPVMFVVPFAVKARVLVLSVPDVMVRVPLTMVAKPSVAVFDALLIVRL